MKAKEQQFSVSVAVFKCHLKKKNTYEKHSELESSETWILVPNLPLTCDLEQVTDITLSHYQYANIMKVNKKDLKGSLGKSIFKMIEYSISSDNAVDLI